MYQVYNTATGEAGPIMSETPYALAGEYTVRRMVQKTDEQGNLLYLNQTGVETTDAGDSIPAEYDSEGEQITPSWIDYEPVMIDAGPLWDWHEIVPTPADIAHQVQQSLISAVQNHLDAAARSAGYDDIKSAVTYADEPAVPKFQIEGQRFRAWRSLVWAACYAMLDDVLAGTRTVPTVDELLAELPVLEGE